LLVAARREMRIAIVNAAWDPLAPTHESTLDRFRTLTGWADALASAGATKVVIFQRFHRPGLVSRGDVDYCFVEDRGPARPPDWYAGGRLSEAVTAFSPDVVHINGLEYPLLSRRLRRGLGNRSAIVLQDHGGFDPERLSPWRKAWMRYGLRAADGLLVATPPQREVFRASGLARPGLAVRDVMEGSTTWGAPAARSAPHRGVAILFVGRLNANKDPLTVLEGFAMFSHARPDATLTFAYQEADLEQELKTAVERHAWLRPRVTLLGPVPHERLPAVYSSADLFVLGSHWEGSGYAALEALACGVVPVLTDIPSFRWLITEGRVGALWRTGDPASLAAALERVASTCLEEQRAIGRAFFDARCSWNAIGRRAVAIYRELSRPRPGSPA
jgi:glycosyltransferase involved in cell wall biosynthesis